MPVQWTPELDLKLLLLLLDTAEFKPRAAWPSIAEALGEEFTGEAVRQHYQKLKKQAATYSVKKDGDDANPSAGTLTPSPKKRKAKLPVVKDEEALNQSTPTRATKRRKSKADDATATASADSPAKVRRSKKAAGQEHSTPPTTPSDDDEGVPASKVMTPKGRVNKKAASKVSVKDEPASSPVNEMSPATRFGTPASSLAKVDGGNDPEEADVQSDNAANASEEQIAPLED